MFLRIVLPASTCGLMFALAAYAKDITPNLEGIWTGGTLTPMERPEAQADKPFLSDTERAEQQPEAARHFWAAGHKADDVGRDNDAFLDDDMTLLATGQTSLVVKPANGRIPLRPEAERQREANLSGTDSYETMSQWDRCITRAPTALFPGAYNNAYQIVQTPMHLVLSAEMVHDARVIPLDNSPHSDARIRTWGGDSRGHWEGTTLVVDTTHFNGRGWIATAQVAGHIRGVPYSDQLHTIERFRLLDASTLHYEITIDDPQYYTEPWTVAFPLHRDDSYVMYEYACHEGNRAIELILGGARAAEQR